LISLQRYPSRIREHPVEYASERNLDFEQATVTKEEIAYQIEGTNKPLAYRDPLRPDANHGSRNYRQRGEEKHDRYERQDERKR